ncbi:MAG: DUF2783 domain-containing protein [Casimicrobiaceae bacterium]
MTTLITESNIADGDAFYAALLALHRDLSEAESAVLNARLILLLANHIGDPVVLHEAMAAARQGIGAADSA